MDYSYQAILFDCDGVIVDTETLSNNIMKSMLADLGLELDSDVLHEKFSGFTTKSNLATATKMLGRPLPETFQADYKARFKQHIEEHLEPIEGVVELLQRIQCPIAMATNANRVEMNEKLSKIGLLDTFSVRFALDDVAHGKPAPDLYLKAAAALGVSPKDCLVIEDSIAGIKAGKAAGMTVLAYCGTMDAKKQTEAGASVCFKTMYELIELLKLNP
ncbi:HAD family hydrolase [Marinomonas dokdonensis]|uniref:HAD family hydrolase n=1 Tax=Marinomonas dokdonensis TaxID=328224 RepID=UPI0040557EA0